MQPSLRKSIAFAFAALALLLAALTAAGCEREQPTTPTACREGTDAFLAALDAAPDAVVLADGETRISDCLVRGQEGGPLAEAGGAMVEAATRLNAEARRRPGGPAALKLGYLLGAARLGAEDTGGIHTDLIRRLEAAAYLSPGARPLAARIESALEAGVAAGNEHG